MPRETKGVVSKVIDEKKEDIGPGCRREEGGELEEEQENDDPHTISLSLSGYGRHQKRILELQKPLLLTLIHFRPASRSGFPTQRPDQQYHAGLWCLYRLPAVSQRQLLSLAARRCIPAECWEFSR